MEKLTPQEVVQKLDCYVIGQVAAKRAIAVALRNRYRRRQLPEAIQKEIVPKNIMMIGPTGVGKTELARRLAKLIDAPFVKVEATRFTEVGYVGRDVESIVYELIENAISIVHQEKLEKVLCEAEGLAIDRIISYLCQQSGVSRRREATAQAGPITARRGTTAQALAEAAGDGSSAKVRHRRAPSRRHRQQMADLMASKQLEDAVIEIEVLMEIPFEAAMDYCSSVHSEDKPDGFCELTPPFGQYAQKRVRRVSVREARRLLTREEADKLIDFDQVVDDAIQRAEQLAVVFIDEIDKIAGPRIDIGADVSGQGVQRDLLPIVEGSTVMTRYGPVKTDHILFIAAGAFHQNKPSDLIPEFQGRFPLRVELRNLGVDDLVRVLTEPENALTKQYAALLSTESVDLRFTADGIRRIAEIAQQVNERTENIGARRLHTVVERVLEEISFSAPDHVNQTVTVDASYVEKRLGDLARDEDLNKFIL